MLDFLPENSIHMPVQNHETHDSTRRDGSHRYGCHNKTRRREQLTVKDGWETNIVPTTLKAVNGLQKFKDIPDFGSLECRYDQSLADPQCDGCEHRGSGEAYAKTIIQLAMTTEPKPEVSKPDTTEAACTCPSGDGSLRWPCPQHHPEQSGIKLVVMDEAHLDLVPELPAVFVPVNPYTDQRQRQGWERGFADRQPFNYPPDVDYMAAYQKGKLDRAEHQKRKFGMVPEGAK